MIYFWILFLVKWLRAEINQVENCGLFSAAVSSLAGGTNSFLTPQVLISSVMWHPEVVFLLLEEKQIHLCDFAAGECWV